MISFENVSKIFKPDAFGPPFEALTQTSFEIKPQKVTGFLGANGAGKSTSMKIMMDFIRPTKGKVIYHQQLGKNKNEIFENIGFLPERPFFYPNLTGEDFLFFMGSLVKVSKPDIKKSIEYWAQIFKIDYALKRKIATYSKGMLQRLGFMATLLHKPELIILDEPLSGLDPLGRKDLKEIINQVSNEGKTVFFSSHIVSDIEEVSQEVIFIKQGRVIFNDSLNELYEKNKLKTYEIHVGSESKIELSTPCQQEVFSHGHLKLFVEKEFKNKLIEELIQKNIEISSLSLKKVTLEEIFYRTEK